MSLISQAPLTYGTFYGTNPGLYQQVSSNVAFSTQINLAYHDRPTEFAKKTGSTIEFLKSGKFQVFLKFNCKFTCSLPNTGSPFYMLLRLKKNTDILKELNYSRTGPTYSSQVNQFKEELYWQMLDTGNFNNTTTGSFFALSGSLINLSGSSIFSTNIFNEFSTGDILSLDISFLSNSLLDLYINNIEIMINEVKY